jgi:uncharacterized membrane protein (UPF0182 family)
MITLLQIQETSEDNTGIILAIIVVLVALAIYMGICACVGKYAKNRGRSFWLFFFIAFILNPVIGFIIAALAGESNSFREERIRREVQIRMEEEQRYRQQYYQTPPPRE